MANNKEIEEKRKVAEFVSSRLKGKVSFEQAMKASNKELADIAQRLQASSPSGETIEASNGVGGFKVISKDQPQFQQSRATGQPFEARSPEQLQRGRSELPAFLGGLGGSLATARRSTPLAALASGTMGAGAEAYGQLAQHVENLSGVDLPFVRGENAPETAMESLRRTGGAFSTEFLGEAGGRFAVDIGKRLGKTIAKKAGDISRKVFAPDLTREASKRVVDLSEREGLPFSLSDITGGPVAAKIEAFVRQTISGGKKFRLLDEAKVAAFDAYKARGLTKVGPNVRMGAVGKFAIGSIKESMDLLTRGYKDQFKLAENQLGKNLTVTMTNAHASARKLLNILDDLGTTKQQFIEIPKSTSSIKVGGGEGVDDLLAGIKKRPIDKRSVDDLIKGESPPASGGRETGTIRVSDEGLRSQLGKPAAGKEIIEIVKPSVLEESKVRKLAHEILAMKNETDFKKFRAKQKFIGHALSGKQEGLPAGPLKMLYAGMANDLKFMTSRSGNQAVGEALEKGKRLLLDKIEFDKNPFIRKLTKQGFNEEKIVGELLKPNNSKNAYALRAFMGEDSWPVVEKALAEDLLSKNASDLGKLPEAMEKLGSSTVDALFNKETIAFFDDLSFAFERGQLKDLKKLTKARASFNLVNAVQGGMAINLLTTGSVGTKGIVLLTPAMIANLATNPQGRNLVQKALNLKKTDPAARGVFQGIMNISLGRSSAGLMEVLGGIETIETNASDIEKAPEAMKELGSSALNLLRQNLLGGGVPQSS